MSSVTVSALGAALATHLAPVLFTAGGPSAVDGLLLAVAAGILVWGFERYRSRFVKADLLGAVVLTGGLALVVFAPGVFDTLGAALNINQRFVVVSLIANLVFLLMILYLVTLVRTTRADLSDLTRSLTTREASRADGGGRTIYVVIPAYNEAETIRSVVQSLPETIRGHAVQPLVVSDGSADRTATEADCNGAIVVEHPINQGQGGALKTGFDVAQQNGADIVVTMDADGQHPVTELEDLVAPIVDGEADFVMGSRYKGVNESGNGTVREAGIRTFTLLINVLTKSEITDCTNGYRAIRGSKLDDLTLTEERFSAPELIIEARKNGLGIRELPITIEERKAGDTKKPTLGYAFGLTRAIITTWIR
ncbi:DUF2304 family protein [Natrinema salifodinae]|uniref:Glycosyltransferase involved in cell wall bisynthesis n=1 Tax=Natrinema salifodinae TaxID=1202768 RepID=A0A1I0M6B8_9EURY|nr:DUF2304 family protein [Natrinema salifodinae]SEV83893.1 Glycosyltransferase involved in cell wall bisynthesis [Natrinema salifodinae]